METYFDFERCTDGGYQLVLRQYLATANRDVCDSHAYLFAQYIENCLTGWENLPEHKFPAIWHDREKKPHVSDVRFDWCNDVFAAITGKRLFHLLNDRSGNWTYVVKNDAPERK